jgi:hypothetical protein
MLSRRRLIRIGAGSEDHRGELRKPKPRVRGWRSGRAWRGWAHRQRNEEIAVSAHPIPRPEPAPPLAPFLIAISAVGLAIYALLGALAVWEAAGGGFLPVALLVAFGLGLVVAALGVARLLRRC